MSRQQYPPPPPPSQGSGSIFHQQMRRVPPESPPSSSTTFQRSAHQQPPGSGSGSSRHAVGHSAPYQYSPSTPVALNLSRISPTTNSAVSPRAAGLTMEPYNPRRWTQRGQVSGSQMVFGRASETREATGMEASLPSPPPPYSADHAAVAQPLVRPSPMIDHGSFSASPPGAESAVHSSPPVPMSPAFPPPPGPSSQFRDRSSAGVGGAKAFFGLSGRRGKQPIVADELLQPSSPGLLADARPPAARRAASTSQLTSLGRALVSPSAPDFSDDSIPDNHWQPGMALPPPPPGPPPPGARSQSVDRYPSSSSNGNSLVSETSLSVYPQQTRSAALRPILSPIPHTPASWVDADAVASSSTQEREADWHPLRIDTGAHPDAALARRPAKRESSSQGLRERRSQSRKARESHADILPTTGGVRVTSPDSGAIRRRKEHARTVSGYAEPASQTRTVKPAHSKAQQPQPGTNVSANVMTPPYTPAIGSQDGDGLRRSGFKQPSSAASDMPVSRLLHTPNGDANIPAPSSPARPPSAGSQKTSARLGSFALQALERHRAFVEKEVAATSDEERLELFATFIVHESRLRRDRYQVAYHAMAGDLVDLTRDLWRSYTKQSKRAVTSSTSRSSFEPTIPSWASDGQPASADGGISSSASSFGNFTPATDAASVGDPNESLERAASRQWGEEFKPSLSPIPSMAVSTVPDEDSSRGRAPSRWWERDSGSGSIGKPDRIEKSRRETKYMGINPASLQEPEQASPPLSRHTPTPGASTGLLPRYGENEYPPEKVGRQEEILDFNTPLATPQRGERQASTPGFEALDVSRLVTLPPPYPRHYPAVNNNHPELAGLRSEHRVLADHTEIQKIKDAYLDRDFAIQREHAEAAKKRRATQRKVIQDKIADGSMSFADAARTDAEFDAEEAERGKNTARTRFDLFESSVSHPLNNFLTERLERANRCIVQLRDELDRLNHVSDPNQAQEEGDEQPERLEKLTLLKWLFEAREQLHKEMYDLHAQRSEKYSEVILTPYRIAKQQAKMDEASAFFAKDNLERQATFARESLKRFEDLRSVIEVNVSRGVEDQLSAFWDIAPGLLELIQHVPLNIAAFEIQIPPEEYEENPAYNKYPLQYLYSLLSHAEESAYQFIESQTNLLCLLHEVRTATTKSNLRVIELERSMASPKGSEQVKTEMEEARRVEEGRLTTDLKEKVGEVERQWKEALGDGIEECKGRVRGWLEENGGWEDGLDG